MVVAVQTRAPVLHDVVPTTHGLAGGVQVEPASHETQEPLPSQTRFEPHGVPGVTAVCTQLGEPTASHATEPVWQSSAGAQAVPATHAHVPALQFRSVPQTVPLGCEPVAVQTGPLAHEENVAMSQGLPVVHELPTVQPVQVPPLQT